MYEDADRRPPRSDRSTACAPRKPVAPSFGPARAGGRILDLRVAVARSLPRRLGLARVGRTGAVAAARAHRVATPDTLPDCLARRAGVLRAGAELDARRPRRHVLVLARPGP